MNERNNMAITKKAPSKQSKANKKIAIPDLVDNENPKAKFTRVVIHCDVGFNNNIFIRGNGANLSWDQGILLRNTRPDEWVWETNQSFHSCEFKVLINDTQYEQGNNHKLNYADDIEYRPIF